MKEPILEVKNLKKYFPIVQGFLKKHVGDVKAVDGLSFNIRNGETLGLVGESGCGKTTASRSIIRLLEPTSGDVFFHMKDQVVNIPELDQKELWSTRRYLQLIFQDPYASLDARMTIKEIISEPLICFQVGSKKERQERVAELLELVGLKAAYMSRYPHAFSGGQRQRIGIARALALNPEVVIADEPVSALDVSVQAQILNLMQDLQERLGLTYLFISHDLGVVQYFCNRVAVMYAGKLVEMTETETLFHNTKHPYVEALLSAILRPDPHYKLKRMVLKGEVVDSSKKPEGCAFHPRCQYAKDICSQKIPQFKNISDKETPHWVACHFSQELDLNGVNMKLG